MYSLTYFIERLVDKFPSLKKIVLYCCQKTQTAMESNANSQGLSSNTTFHVKLVEKMTSRLHMYRGRVKNRQYWARKKIPPSSSTKNDPKDQNENENLVYERIKEPGKGRVELEVYNSAAVAGKNCVFDSGVSEEREEVPQQQQQHRLHASTGDWVRTAKGGWILISQPVIPPTPVIKGREKEPDSSC
jgi:hypothetical protein